MSYWKDSLKIGVEAIDVQHRKLVMAIDDLMDACAKGQGRNKVEETMRFVVDYTKEHFRDEEVLQAKYAYPGMAAHKQLHAQFIQNMAKLDAELRQAGPSIALTANINKTLVNWLIKHISSEDKKLGEYIKSKE